MKTSKPAGTIKTSLQNFSGFHLKAAISIKGWGHVLLHFDHFNMRLSWLDVTCHLIAFAFPVASDTSSPVYN